jgi:hypothetical protein
MCTCALCEGNCAHVHCVTGHCSVGHLKAMSQVCSTTLQLSELHLLSPYDVAVQNVVRDLRFCVSLRNTTF